MKISAGISFTRKMASGNFLMLDTLIFLRIIDCMLYIIEPDFEGGKLVDKHEHCYMENEFRGNQCADKRL